MHRYLIRTCRQQNNLSEYITTDGKRTLESKDDAATQNWGGNWRMPTREEYGELKDNYTWTFTEENGVAGHKITGSNSNSIFLPVTGYRDGTNLYDESAGYYWSASRYTNNLSYYLYFTNPRDLYKYDRCLGFTVRAVVTKEKIATTLENVELPAILVENGRVSCASEFRIYDTLGRDVTKDNGNLKGVFVVKGASFVEKIVVR